MDKKFDSYLKEIGITELFYEKAKEIINIYITFFSIEVTDIFVSEYINEEDVRQYENLWLFNPRFVMEAKNFLIEDDFDLAPIYKRIKHLELTKKEYDFKTPSRNSRLTIDFNTLENISGNLKASRENCTTLQNIFLKYIITNVWE